MKKLFLFLIVSGMILSDSISNKTKDMEKLSGYFNMYWDSSSGKLWLEINDFDKEFLYVNSLTAGIGSNDIGLDRGQLGNERIVFFKRIGPKVLMMQPNYTYRALTTDKKEKQSVLKELFKEEQALDTELNSNLKINLSAKLINNSFINNFDNNNGRINYNGNLKNISRFRFSKIDNFDQFEPEIVFNNDNLIFFDNKGSILKFNNSSKLIRSIDEISLVVYVIKSLILLITEVAVLLGISTFVIFYEPKGSLAVILFLGFFGYLFFE